MVQYLHVSLSIFDRWPAKLAPAVTRGKVAPLSRAFPIERHLAEAVAWILAARRQSHDGGIPAYYDLLRGRWRSSYPETTGYTIPTLLACSERLERPDLRVVAIGLADYLLKARAPEGGVGHWDRDSRKATPPIVFDTGQVIFGWLAAWQATASRGYLDAAVAAADWLVRIQDGDGAWRVNQHLGTVKVIDARVALALVEVDRVTGGASYIAAAQRNLDWVLTQQEDNGWFRSAAFQTAQDPFTHTIAYTAEGLLECGLRLNQPRYVAAAERVADTLLTRQRRDGSLASTYNAAWQPTSSSSCLTGNCQMALLWLRLHERARDPRYLSAAERAIAYTAATQDLRSTDPGIRGAIAGSFPIYGSYERMKYPNWAAKFFIDALLALEAAERVG